MYLLSDDHLHFQGSFELAVGSFTYTVVWSLLQPKSRGNRSFILSEPFTIGGYKWILQFYPYGDTEENSVSCHANTHASTNHARNENCARGQSAVRVLNHLLSTLQDYSSIFLSLLSDEKDVAAFYQFTLDDRSGGNRRIIRGRGASQGPCNFQKKGWYAGFRRFVKRTELSEGGLYIRDGTLVIQCQVEVVIGCREGAGSRSQWWSVLNPFKPKVQNPDRAMNAI